jgi:putative DNA primase/helicase
LPFAPTAHKVADLLDATKGICHMAKDVPTPTWLADNKHPASEIVSCKNGLVHWPTRTLLPHRPSFFVHHAVPFAFDPNAPAPRKWIAFLDELWGADRQSISTLQEMFGYLVSGDTTSRRCFC